MLDVLIADDAKTMRLQVMSLVREVLPDAVFTLVENGAEVLKAWSMKPPQLTILDIHMPLLNGLEVMRHAVASGLGVPPVVIYTASRDESLRAQCLDAGAAAVVTKSREDIHAAIRAALRLAPAEVGS